MTSASIFVSHSHADNDFALQLVHDLRYQLGGDKSSVWYDQSGGLNGGDAWWQKIVSEITARPVFIVVLSPAAMDSTWVNDEISIAWQQKNSPRGKLIVPILYRPCVARADLDTIHQISFVQPKPYTQALAELTDVLGRSGESNLSGSEFTLSPGSEEVLRQAAQLAEENGWASAAARLEVAHEQEPRNPGIAAGLGLSYCALGKRSEALPLIDMGIKFFSTFPESTALLPESTPLLSDYLALLWVQKSVCLSALNRTTDALLAIERALYADPEGQYAYILWLVKAKAFQEANDLSKARNAYLTAIKYRQQAKPEFLSAPDIANLEKEFDTMFAH